jgi:hypothetical protein
MQKVVEAGVLEMGGDMVRCLKICILLLKIRKIVKYGNGSMHIGIFNYSHIYRITLSLKLSRHVAIT